MSSLRTYFTGVTLSEHEARKKKLSETRIQILPPVGEFWGGVPTLERVAYPASAVQKLKAKKK